MLFDQVNNQWNQASSVKGVQGLTLPDITQNKDSSRNQQISMKHLTLNHYSMMYSPVSQTKIVNNFQTKEKERENMAATDSM